MVRSKSKPKSSDDDEFEEEKEEEKQEEELSPAANQAPPSVAAGQQGSSAGTARDSGGRIPDRERHSPKTIALIRKERVAHRTGELTVSSAAAAVARADLAVKSSKLNQEEKMYHAALGEINALALKKRSTSTSTRPPRRKKKNKQGDSPMNEDEKSEVDDEAQYKKDEESKEDEVQEPEEEDEGEEERQRLERLVVTEQGRDGESDDSLSDGTGGGSTSITERTPVTGKKRRASKVVTHSDAQKKKRKTKGKQQQKEAAEMDCDDDASGMVCGNCKDSLDDDKSVAFLCGHHFCRPCLFLEEGPDLSELDLSELYCPTCHEAYLS